MQGSEVGATMSVCVIPARGGSKRIPRKNIKEFNGNPINAYSIEAALKSNCFDKVIVSNDFTATNPVISHAVDWMKNQGNLINHVCCLYATAPFIESNSISNAYTKFKDMKADFCFSVTSFPFPIQRAIKINKSGKVVLFQPEQFHSRSQDLEETYHDAGQFYWGTKQAFNIDISILSEVVIPYILPRHLVQDIDSPEDWTRAEIMHQVIQKMNREM